MLRNVGFVTKLAAPEARRPEALQKSMEAQGPIFAHRIVSSNERDVDNLDLRKVDGEPCFATIQYLCERYGNLLERNVLET